MTSLVTHTVRGGVGGGCYFKLNDDSVKELKGVKAVKGRNDSCNSNIEEL